MGFDWKAFGAAFLDKQTEGIRKRRDDAEEYEEEQEELAKANRKAIADRTLLATEYGQMAEKAMALGATKEQVMAAMGSGAMGIKTFYEKLLAAANQKGMQTLGAADVEAIIEMPEVFEVNPAYVDMKVGELAKIMYGAKMDPTLAAEEPAKTRDNVIASMFGFSAKDQAKKRLGATPFLGQVSITDVKELASQAEYDSLFPNLGVNFFDREFYGPEAAGDFVKDLSEIEVDAIDSKAQARIDDVVRVFNSRMDPNRETYDEEFAERMKAEGYTAVDAAEDAREAEIGRAARAIVDTTIGRFGQTGLFDHEPSVNLMKKIMGEEYVLNQMRELDLMPDEEDTELTDREENLGSAEAIRTGMEEAEARTQAGVIEQENPETQTPDTETQETTLPPEETDDEFVPIPRPESKGSIIDAIDAGGVRAWDKKYKGKLDPVTGRKIMVDPRPPAGGPKDKEVEARTSTGTRVPGKTRKVTAQEEWDILYGKTHNPDGSPKL